MKNFQPGGLRNRKPDLGGRPSSDANKYAPKKRFDDKRPSYGNERPKGDVQLFSTNCTTCGKSCEVPFRPDGKKPVLCKDCFASKNAPPTNMSAGRERFTQNELVGHKPARQFDVQPKFATPNNDLLIKQLSVLEEKLNQVIDLIKASEKLASSLPILGADVSSLSVEKISTETKVRKPRKVTTAIKKAAVKKKAAVAKKVAKKTVVKKAVPKKAAK